MISKPGKYRFLFALAAIGISAITAQILLVRELINVFFGNELIYGFVIFLWLILYAFGCGILGRFAEKIKNKIGIFNTLINLVAILLPTEIFLTRISKNLLGFPSGAEVNLLALIFISFWALAPITIILGFLFSLGSKALAEFLGKNSRSISQVYIAEALGALLGGIVFTFLLIRFFNTFTITGILSIIIFSAVLLIRFKWFKLLLFLISAALLLYAPMLDQTSAKLSWKNYNLVRVADSPYGRISITKDKDSYSLFENGELVFSTGGILEAEEIAHVSLLQHPNPKRILLISGGLGGIIVELFKYPGARIDYVNLNKKIITLTRNLIPRTPRLKVITDDGVSYLNKSREKYDAIIMNLPDPSTANTNRFYTVEFFKKCQAHLAQGGILTFNLETSATYMGRELKLLNQSIHKTLAQVFQDTMVIPGSYNYYFGSDQKLLHEREYLLRRWKMREIATHYFNKESLYYLLWPDRLNYVTAAVNYNEATQVNSDLRPISYFYKLLVWTGQRSSNLKNFFYSLMKLKMQNILIALGLFALLIKIISLKIKRIALPTVLAFLGFTGMCVQLIVIYTFQSMHGFIYQAIGILTAAFMAGLALGGFLVYKKYEQLENPLKILKIIILALIAFLIALFFFLRTFPLPLASMLVALPVGAAFPLAVKIHEKHNPQIGSLAGVLYGSDLLGGSLAAIVTTIIFIPVFGLLETFLIPILLGAAALIMAYS